MKVLDPILLTNFHGESFKDDSGEDAKMTLKSFIYQKLADAKFGRDYDAISSAFQIKQAVSGADDDAEFIALETKDWETLNSVVKSPSEANQYNPVLSHCLIPFMKAIIDAVDELPKDESDSEELEE